MQIVETVIFKIEFVGGTPVCYETFNNCIRKDLQTVTSKNITVSSMISFTSSMTSPTGLILNATIKIDWIGNDAILEKLQQTKTLKQDILKYYSLSDRDFLDPNLYKMSECHGQYS